ncbi:hypothetical protein BH11PSE8_BH11PSE8_28850 [soil metagenome]
MNRTSGTAALGVVVLALSACGSDDSTPRVTVDDLAAGSYVVSIGDANAPTVGKYYASADGSRLLVVADATDHAQQVYKKAANQAWVAAPAVAQDVTVTLLRSGAVTANTVALASLAGHYVTSVATGITASFDIDASGAITAGTSACKLSGRLSPGKLPNTLVLDLTTSGCGTLPAASTGVLVIDADYAPASYRLVAESGTQLLDLWAFSE